MKVFVTGGAGYVGSVCVEELLNDGHTVTVFDNLSEGHRAAVDSRATFVEGDLANREVLFQAFRTARPDAVMHFASNTLVSVSMTQPGKYLGDNVANAVNLLDACVETGVRRFVFSSTCAIFGIPTVVPITEDLPKNPINPYGESKWSVERVLRWYDQLHGIRHVCLRYFNAAGASEKFGEHHRIETHLIPNILKVPLGQTPRVEVYGTTHPTPDGTCIRDYIHIIDLAQGHLRALDLTAEKSDVFNLGTGHGFSVREVIDAARQITGHPIPSVDQPARPGDPPRLVADSTKARRILGWKPRYESLPAIIESAWRWHQAHPTGY
jgi:UDP-glucose 4-epimerase